MGIRVNNEVLIEGGVYFFYEDTGSAGQSAERDTALWSRKSTLPRVAREGIRCNNRRPHHCMRFLLLACSQQRLRFTLAVKARINTLVIEAHLPDWEVRHQ